MFLNNNHTGKTMAREPMDEIKMYLKDVHMMCDDVVAQINASNQSKASTRLIEIEQTLEKIKTKLRNEFGWLQPQQASIKKSRF